MCDIFSCDILAGYNCNLTLQESRETIVQRLLSRLYGLPLQLWYQSGTAQIVGIIILQVYLCRII
jgi:hypothetical protein